METLNTIHGLEEIVARNSLIAVGIATVILLILVTLSLKLPNASENLKKLLFFSMAGVVIGTTLFLGVATVWLNAISSSKGPVHWHADIQMWACGTEIDLRNPKGLSNKIGTATLHEHNDKRIHLEGVVVTPLDASLGKFMTVIGGALSDHSMTVPVDQGIQTFQNGETCPTGQPAEVQVFVYKTDGKTYTQTKLANPSNYIISPFSTVPSGDCIIFEFDSPKARTDRICQSFEVANKIGKLEGEAR